MPLEISARLLHWSKARTFLAMSSAVASISPHAALTVRHFTYCRFISLRAMMSLLSSAIDIFDIDGFISAWD